MDRSRSLAAAAVALSLLGRIEYRPAFAVAGTPRTSAAALRGAAAAASPPQPSAGAGAGGCTAAAALALGAAALAGGRAAGRQAGRRVRVQRQADTSGLTPNGPVVTYTKALMDVAGKKKESVPVTKDVMKIRALFDDDDFLDELMEIVNEPDKTPVEVATAMAKLMGPFESTVMAKFITFLAKKKRPLALKPICKEYVASLYFNQSIAPVVVRSASRLTSEQAAGIEEKMKAKTGCADVKLINEVDGGLMAGFVLEWGFTDPENLDTPTEGIDLSLKTYLEKAAINQGVIATVF